MITIAYQVFSWLLLIPVITDGAIGTSSNMPPISRQLYVVPFPSIIDNNGDGSLAHPYSSLQQALSSVEDDFYHQDISSIYRTTINLYPTYHFIGTIHLKGTPPLFFDSF